MADRYKTVITVTTTTNKDGSPIDGPSNILTDSTGNLTKEQARASTLRGEGASRWRLSRYSR